MSGRRALLTLALVLPLVCAGANRVAADTTATMDITVTVQDAGTLAISFGLLTDGYVFRDGNGSALLAVSAISGATGTATIRVAWNDTRTEEAREPFQLTLAASDLVSDGNAPGLDRPAVILASQMRIVQIGPDAVAAPMPLDTAQVVYTAPDEPAAGEGTLDIVIQLDVPVSSPAVMYQSTLTLSVSPLDDGL